MPKDKWVLTDADGNEVSAAAEVAVDGSLTFPAESIKHHAPEYDLKYDPVPVIDNGEETAHGIAVHLAAILRSVADAPLEPPLDPMTWRAAMLAVARIVEEDDALRGGRHE